MLPDYFVAIYCVVGFIVGVLVTILAIRIHIHVWYKKHHKEDSDGTDT